MAKDFSQRDKEMTDREASCKRSMDRMINGSRTKKAIQSSICFPRVPQTKMRTKPKPRLGRQKLSSFSWLSRNPDMGHELRQSNAVSCPPFLSGLNTCCPSNDGSEPGCCQGDMSGMLFFSPCVSSLFNFVMGTLSGGHLHTWRISEKPIHSFPRHPAMFQESTSTRQSIRI